MEKYLDVMRWGEEQSGIKMLAPDFEVISMLFDTDQITPFEMVRHFSGSNANFFKILKSLEAKDVVKTEVDPSDRRSRRYKLTDKALAILAAQWRRYSQEFSRNPPKQIDLMTTINDYTNEITQTLKIRQFTCEYQIFVYLNANPGLTNLKFHDLLDVSKATFERKLSLLAKSGAIHFVKDPSDHRSKLYYISDHQKRVMDALGARILAWIDRRLGYFEALLVDVS